MLRYVAAASVMKMFSATAGTRKMYRALANWKGQERRIRSGMPVYYLERVKWKLELCRKYNMLRPGDTIFELGTGWMHWEAITLRLFYDVAAVLYDVWDNRQLNALKAFLQQLDQAYDHGYSIRGTDQDKARRLIRRILELDSYPDLYRELGFRYIVDRSGGLRNIPEVDCQLVISAGVLEHVERGTVSTLLSRSASLLKPGGFAIHAINIGDHLAHYDRTASSKQYLSFSPAIWKTFFENRVQYVNLIQRHEWLDRFRDAGLSLIEESGTYHDLSALKVNNSFSAMDTRDRDCVSLSVVLQKPFPASPNLIRP